MQSQHFYRFPKTLFLIGRVTGSPAPNLLFSQRDMLIEGKYLKRYLKSKMTSNVKSCFLKKDEN